MGSLSIKDCICDNDNEYLDSLTKNCENCPDNTIKSKSTNGDITDCVCDSSKGWYNNPNWTSVSTDQEYCIRCGWDEDKEELKQGFTYNVTKGDSGKKIGECKCAPGFTRNDGDNGEIKCFPTGKCSTSEYVKDGSPKDGLDDYKQKLVESAKTNEEPQNICNGLGAKLELGKNLTNLKHKDIRLKYENDGSPLLENGVPVFSEIGNKFIRF